MIDYTHPPFPPTMSMVVNFTYKLESHSFVMKEDVYNTAPAIIAGIRDGVMSIFICCPYSKAVIVHAISVDDYGYGPGQWHYPDHVAMLLSTKKERKGVMVNG